MHDFLAQLEAVKARWMVGGEAAQTCPEPWREALGDQPELDLLALTGAFSALALHPEFAGKATERALLPKIPLAPLPAQAAALFRRLIEDKATNTEDVVTLIAARGYAVSPTDWMPKSANAEVPDVYRPWLDWLADAPVDHEGDIPTAETWDRWAPHARLAAVEQLRDADPAAARALIEDVAPTLSADARRRLISILHHKLSSDDADFLATLETDRSGKVQAYARGLLSRLGRFKANSEAQAEFAGFFEVGRAGMLSRKKLVSSRKLKNNAQRKRREDLAEALSLSALAQGLGISNDELIETWSMEEGTHILVNLAAATGTDAEVERLLARLLEKDISSAVLAPLFPRISGASRRAAALQIARVEPKSLDPVCQCLGQDLGVIGYDVLKGAAVMKELCASLTKEKEDYAARHLNDTVTRDLGLIATQDAAQRLLDDFTSLGLMSADPRLCLLRLNAALKETPRD